MGAVVLVERGLQFGPGGFAGIVAGDQIEPIAEGVDRGRRRIGDGGDDRIVGVLTEPLVGPVAASDADDRGVQSTAALQVVEGREQLALG